MTIALVANSTWNIYNFRLNILDKLIKEGHKVIVIAPIDEYIIYREKYPSVRHIGLRTLDRDGVNPLKDILLTLELSRKYRKLNVDLVIHYTNKPNIYGGFASKMAKINSIAVVTGLGFAFLHEGLINKITKILYKLSARFHKKLIFENTSDRQYFIDQKIVSEDKAFAVKGCGVDLNYYQPSDNGILKDQLVFSFIGRLLYDKGIVEFIEAAKIIKAKYSNVLFWVIGELDSENPSTIDKEDLNTWIQDKTIEYHGFIQDVRPIIRKSNCIVLPSYREGLPRTIIEGMAMGKAVITTRTAGCEETVDENVNGFLVDIKNVSQLSQAMEKFIRLSENEKLLLGQAGRKKAEKEFGSETISNQIYDIVVND